MSESSHKLSFFDVLLSGVILSVFFTWIQNSRALPLLDFYPDFFLYIVLPVLSGAAVILLFFQKKYFSSFLVLSFLSFLIVTVFKYSSGYAFRSFVLFVILYALVVKNLHSRDKKTCAVYIISALFIFAGIQKLNSVFLSGSEFLAGSPLMSFVKLWFPGSDQASFGESVLLLPGLSIFLELFIGVAILIKPEFFAHFAALFMLTVAFINPPVLSVYFITLPILYMIDERLELSLVKKRISPYWFLPFLWAGLIFFLTPMYRTFDEAMLRLYPALIMFTLLHLYFLKESVFKTNKLPVIGKKKTLYVVPFLMFLFFIGSYVYFPSPFGFKMFSGKRFYTGYFDLKIQNTEACNESFKRWTIAPVTDAALIEDESSCHLLFPTRGGVNYAGRFLCLKNTNLTFILKNSDDFSESFLKCADFNN